MRLGLLLVAAIVVLAAAPAAYADGDPAGDVLIQQPVFYGSALDLRSKEAAQLPALLAAAKAKGLEIRTAALTVPEDLGAIGYLWDDPTNYADFLSAEIQSTYVGRTLVVMPSGYGIWRRGHSSVRDQRVLDKLTPPGEDAAAVLPGAMEAVIALAKARGIELTIPDVEPPPGGVTQPVSHYQQQAAATATPSASGGGSGGWLFALPLVLLVLAAGAFVARRAVRGARA